MELLKTRPCCRVSVDTKREFLLIDGVVEDRTLSSISSLTRSTDRPFDEKSPGEKEELFERIAAQLAEIGDLYKLSSPVDCIGKSLMELHHCYLFIESHL